MGETSALLWLSASGLATHFSGSSWGSVGQGSVGRGLVRLARSGTGEKSRQPGGRRPLELDGFQIVANPGTVLSRWDNRFHRASGEGGPFFPSTPSGVAPPREAALSHWPPHPTGRGRRLVPTPRVPSGIRGQRPACYDPPRVLFQVEILSVQWPAASNRTGLATGGHW